MIYIKPVSDLRNKYPEIERLVLKKDAAVYLTKNGHGSMVVMSLKKYEDLVKKLHSLETANLKEETITNTKETIKQPKTLSSFIHEEIFHETDDIEDIEELDMEKRDKAESTKKLNEIEELEKNEQ